MDALAFVPISVMLALGPGPNNFCAMQNGMRSSTAKAVAATTGRVAAFALFLTASAIGLGAMLLASETAFTLVKWIGAGYLLWLGWSTWRSKDISILNSMQAHRTATDPTPWTLWRMVRQEFFLAITNPKAIVLFAAIFPQFINPSQAAIPQFALLGTIYLCAEFVSSAVYATFGRWLQRWVTTPRHALRMNKATGGIFMGAGGLLLGMQR